MSLRTQFIHHISDCLFLERFVVGLIHVGNFQSVLALVISQFSLIYLCYDLYQYQFA